MRSPRTTLALFLLGLALLITGSWGCYAMSTLQEPNTVPAGRFRVGPQVRITQGRLGETNIRPAIDAQFRIGLRERLELQLLASTGGTGRLGIKALLVDWPSFMLAIVPSYQVQYMEEDSDEPLDEDFWSNYVVNTAIVPVVIGVPVAAPLDLLFGADVHAGWRKDLHPTGQSGPVLAFGAHVGLAVHGPRGHSTFVPQCGVLVGALDENARDKDGYEYSTLRRGSVRWECALGVNFGSKYENRTR